MSIGRSWYLGKTIRKIRIKRCLCITITPCPIPKPKHLLNSRVWMCPQKLVFFLELEAFWGIRTTSIHFAQDQEANWTSSCRKLSLKSPLIRIDYRRETLWKSPEFSLHAALSSPVFCPTNSRHLSLPIIPAWFPQLSKSTGVWLHSYASTVHSKLLSM